MLDNIKIILVNTSHPGNIGATARAMKNMGLSQLLLVAPKFFPHVEATARAAGADNILAKAVQTSTIEEAIQDCQLVIATSARGRALSLPLLTPRELTQQIFAFNKMPITAILFGRESNGLSNEELKLCNYQVQIPTSENFSSLNVASAVQIIAYEIFTAYQQIFKQQNTITQKIVLNQQATSNDISFFYRRLEQTLTSINFLSSGNAKSIMAKLYRLFNRVKLEKKELKILQGILTTIEKHLRNN